MPMKPSTSRVIVLALLLVVGAGGGLAVTESPAAPVPTETNETAPEMHVTSLGPTEETITEGDRFAVTAGITNVGDANGTADVSLSIEVNIDGVEVDRSRVRVTAGETSYSRLWVSNVHLDPGEYNFTVATPDDSASGTLTVEANNDWWEPAYVDEDGVATLDGTLAAIDDHESGDLALDRALLVIDSYEQQVPLADLQE